MALTLLDAPDDDTSGGVLTTGTPFEIARNVDFLEPFSSIMNHYPNWKVNAPGRFIKGIFTNASAATIENHVTISLRYV
jgi:hypothetical protein